VPAGIEPVYDITVADAHEFFANGVLVSNCDALRYFMIQFHRWDGEEQGARVRMLMDDEAPIPLAPLRAGERETDPHDVPLKYTPDNGWLVWARETYTTHGRSRIIDLLEDR